MHVIKSLIAALLLLGLLVWAARSCKRDTGSYRAFFHGIALGFGFLIFIAVVGWLIFS